MVAGLVGGVDQGADGADGAAALADDQPDIGGMQADAVSRFASLGDFGDLDVVGVIDETAHHKFEEVFHGRARVLKLSGGCLLAASFSALADFALAFFRMLRDGVGRTGAELHPMSRRARA